MFGAAYDWPQLWLTYLLISGNIKIHFEENKLVKGLTSSLNLDLRISENNSYLSKFIPINPPTPRPINWCGDIMQTFILQYNIIF